jgi:hypothetical protein
MRSHPDAGGGLEVNREALGNILKDIGWMGLGAVVTAAGGSLTGGGAVICGGTAGVLCPAGAVAVVGGVAISAAGAAIAATGGQRFGSDWSRLLSETGGSSSGGSKLFPNQMPGSLPGEVADAERLGVKPMTPASADFDNVINSGPIKWAVLEDGSLVVIPKEVAGVELKHSILSGGRPVQAAGEADIAGGNGNYFGLDINNNSGHFRPTPESTQIGIDAFRSFGIGF